MLYCFLKNKKKNMSEVKKNSHFNKMIEKEKPMVNKFILYSRFSEIISQNYSP